MWKDTNLNSPVQNCRKFSAVFGHTSAKSSIFMRPAAMPPMDTSAGENIHQVRTGEHQEEERGGAVRIALAIRSGEW